MSSCDVPCGCPLHMTSYDNTSNVQYPRSCFQQLWLEEKKILTKLKWEVKSNRTKRRRTESVRDFWVVKEQYSSKDVKQNEAREASDGRHMNWMTSGTKTAYILLMYLYWWWWWCDFFKTLYWTMKSPSNAKEKSLRA